TVKGSIRREGEEKKRE
ncbi:hypothetical protein Tco_0515906, partial [Tanacetum coccineum]